MQETILITGGAGVIGSHLTNTLALDSDRRIIVLDNLSSGRLENIQMRPNIRFIEGGVESEEDLDRVFEEPITRVFHLAANFANQNSVDFPRRDLTVNGLGTLQLLTRCVGRDIQRFVYTSSSCVYGNQSKPLDEDNREFSLDTPYAITKLLGERYVNFFQRHHKLPAVILRYFNVYGPHEYPGKYRNVTANFFFRALRNEEIIITGDGLETRDFNFVDDAVRATILASQKTEAVGQVINVASGIETSIIDLANTIIRISGSHSKITYAPRRNWDLVSRRVAAVERARRVLGYAPAVPIEEGLRRYHEWLRKQDMNKCAW